MTVYSTTLSSKNQITLPVELLQKLGWTNGQKFNLIIDGNSVFLKTTQDVLADISEIVSKYNLPKVSVEEAIQQTKTKYQNTKYQYGN